MPHPDISAELNRFREKLLDVTNRNPLLNYRRSKRRTVEVVDQTADQVFNRLVLEGKHFRLQPAEEEIAVEETVGLPASNGAANGNVPAVLDGTAAKPLPPNAVAPRTKRQVDVLRTNLPEEKTEALLNYVRREATTAIEETGVNYLFLALGMLAWRESKDSERELMAPLILIPVEIDRSFDDQSNCYQYTLRWREEEIQANLSLVKRLEKDFGIRLADYEDEQLPSAYFDEIRSRVSSQPDWNVRDELIVGFFSFQKLLMYLDIDPHHWEGSQRIAPDSLLANVVWGADCNFSEGIYASDYRIDDDPKSQLIDLAIDADSSQHSALMDIAAGKNLVIEGPPGTGKSQTITNAIAAALSSGKSVLFVAEKLAALEVVHGKLADLGLSDFCLELHSDAASPRQIFESIRTRLDARFDKPKRLEELKEELERKKQTIAGYLAEMSCAVGPYQDPLYDLLWRVINERAQGQASLPSATCDHTLPRATFEENIKLLEAFGETFLESERPRESPWWGHWPRRLHSGDARSVIDRLSHLKQLADEAQSIVAVLDADFGTSAAQWVESNAGNGTIRKRLAAPEFRRFQVEDWPVLRRLLDDDARRMARQLTSLLGEARPLVADVSKHLTADLNQSREAAYKLCKILENHLRPAAPFATWGDLQSIRPQLDLVLMTMKSPLVTADIRRETAAPRSQSLKGDALLGAVRKLGALAPRLDLVIKDLQGLHGPAALKWIEARTRDTKLPTTLRSLTDEVSGLTGKEDLIVLADRETRNQSRRFCELHAELQALESQSGLALAVDPATALTAAECLLKVLASPGLKLVTTAKWSELQEVAVLLPSLVQQIKSTGSLGRSLFPTTGSELQGHSLSKEDWAPARSSINSLASLYASCHSLQEELSWILTDGAAEWLASIVNDDGLLPRVDQLASLSQLVPAHVYSRGLLDVSLCKRARDLCSLLTEAETLNPLPPVQSLSQQEVQKNARDLATLLSEAIAPVAHGYTWGQIRALVDPLTAFVESVTKAVGISQALELQGLGDVHTLHEYERAEFLCKLVRHSIIIERADVPAALFHRSASIVLEQGRQKTAELLARRDSLAESFNMAGSPPPNEVAETAKALRRSVTHWLRGFHGDYRRAKRKLAEFCRPTVKLSVAEWIERLDDLHQWQLDCASFAGDETYCTAFSNLFQGIGTDWQSCTTLLQWAATAQTRTLDHSAATRLLQLRDVDQLTAAQVVAARRQLSAALVNSGILPLLKLEAGENIQGASLREIQSRSSALLVAVREAVRLAANFAIDDEDALSALAKRCVSTERAIELRALIADKDAWCDLGELYTGEDTDLARLRGFTQWTEIVSSLRLPPAIQNAVFNAKLQHNLESLADRIRKAKQLQANWTADGDRLTSARSWIIQQAEALTAAHSAIGAFRLNGSETVQEILNACKSVQRASKLRTSLDASSRWSSLCPWYDNSRTDTSSLQRATQWSDDLASLDLPDAISRSLLRGDVTVNLELLATSVADVQELLAEWRQTPGLEQVRSWISTITSPLENATKAAATFSFSGNEELSRLEEFCKRAERAAALRDRISDVAAWSKLGPWYQGFDTDLAMLMQAVQWVEHLMELQLPPPMVENLVRRLSESVGNLADLCARYERATSAWQSSFKQLREQIVLGDDRIVWKLVTNSQAANAEQLGALLSHADDLPAWITFCRSRDFCYQRGLEDFTTAVIEGRLDAGNAPACYRFTILERAAEDKLRESATLASFTRKSIEKARESYQQLDRELLMVTRQLVAHRASLRQVPEGICRGRVSELTDLGLLRHEVQKQRRHCRIRDLLSRAGNTVKALKPCFMMSPLSVAQFLDPNGVQFDLVIMDEASQVKPEDAIGTLLRAKQLVVVGDPKQLPPTSFFDRSDDDVVDSEATQFDNNESILEVAMKSFQPVRRLRWHYRSQHESLIHFSNERFYDGDLVVFPSASGDRGSLGVRHHYVEGGRFEGGCNPPEAERVAQAIIQHAIAHPNETLGVGTFNLKQSMIIQDLVDRFCASDPIAREAVELLEHRSSEPLFINNLETLQGHERDVILISYTYGPDPVSGRVMNRFGPVSGPAGWRRINVLVTRARRRVEVFSSMRPGDIAGGPNKSDGVNAFKDYLEYASTGILPQRGSLSDGAPESPFEESLARVIRNMGLEAVPQVGVAGFFIDIGVRLPNCGDFLLGVECDGATYHSARSARDRDRLREEVIRSRGWNLHRVWSTDWYMNQKHEEDRLRRAILESDRGY